MTGPLASPGRPTLGLWQGLCQCGWRQGPHVLHLVSWRRLGVLGGLKLVGPWTDGPLCSPKTIAGGRSAVVFESTNGTFLWQAFFHPGFRQCLHCPHLAARG
jgi:hypothetical protein